MHQRREGIAMTQVDTFEHRELLGHQSRSTGKERDSESGNDYFGARYFGSNIGRFLSPDPAGPWVADVSDPQSWNFYVYGRNNPLINIDPTGLDCISFNSSGAISGITHANNTQSLNEQATNCGANGGNWVNGMVGAIGPANSTGAFSVVSSDADGTYKTTMTAPGQQSDGTICSGNCISDYKFTPAPGYTPQEDIAPSSQRLVQNVAKETATVNKTLNCAGAAAMAWSPIATPDDARDIGEAFADQGVDAGKEAAEAYKNRRVLNMLGLKVKVGRGFRKGAKVGGKIFNLAGKGLSGYGSYQNMQEAGCFSGGSKP
jgi:RHS repeat-associated protein